MADQKLVSIVDDDPSVRDATANLLRASGYATRCFGSARALLGAEELAATVCIVLDVEMPGEDGPRLQARLTALGLDIPLVFVTACTDLEVEARVRQAGAAAFLRKPCAAAALVAAVRAALAGATYPEV